MALPGKKQDVDFVGQDEKMPDGLCFIKTTFLEAISVLLTKGKSGIKN